MSHLELFGGAHGPHSEEIGHDGRLRDLLTESGQVATPTVGICGDRTRLKVEAPVCVDFEYEVARDDWNWW